MAEASSYPLQEHQLAKPIAGRLTTPTVLTWVVM